MRATPAFAAALLAVSLTIAGCGASDEQSSGRADSKADSRADNRGQQDSAAGAAAAKPGSEGRKAQQPAPPGAAAHVIRTAELTVRVKDTQQALAAARATAESAGGRVENESTERTDDGQVESRVVLRVPQQAYDSVLAELAGTGTLLARKAEARDVTDQVVDVDSRVASQRASVTRVRELMDRATDLSDVVTLEGQLSSRQAALESLLAQQATLKDRTTLATITLALSEPPAAEQPKNDEPGFLDALSGGWHAFLSSLRWIGVVLAAVAPFVAALALIYLLWRRVRAWRRRAGSAAGAREPATVPAQPAPSEADAHEQN
jgi:hypothetical protein